VNILLEGFRQHLTIVGFRDVKIGNIDKFFQTVKDQTGNAHVQFFDASLVAGLEHLRFAALNALNAFKDKNNISSSLTMETLLYASARRQIKEAVKVMGIKPNTNRVAILVLTENRDQASTVLKIVSRLLGGRRDDSVVDLTDDKMTGLKRLFAISNVELEAKKDRPDAERQALTDLVIEHMALLVTQR
jgi:tRNA threonylcarbamoyladenosine modification (KEOPS) complex Cgi121 subunit